MERGPEAAKYWNLVECVFLFLGETVSDGEGDLRRGGWVVTKVT